MARFLVRLAAGAACLALSAGVVPASSSAQAIGGTSTTASGDADGRADRNVDASLLPYETFKLENGLKVVFHVDRSDPVVAVNLTAHVGSARELPGRTGFAHLFEHLLFLESENLGKGGLDRLTARIGGSGANGSTSRDRTNYLQTVPSNALEKMLWAEADKLGWFINTVTDPVLAKEKQVVKNEKRQGVDNRPYGHLFSVLRSNLYPKDHPYNWEVIGSLEDLQAATLEDVKTFYRNWYTPNNVTLVVAGDFDTAQARQWVTRYFAEIPRGPDIAPQQPRAATLDQARSFFHEDNFAEQPLLAMIWPTVPQYHPDSYPLTVLASLLSDGKSAPLNEVLIDEEKLTANVSAFTPTNELAGEFLLNVRAFEDIDLDDVAAALEAGFARFEREGFSEDALARVKIEQEVGFYSGLQSVLGKSASLAQYSIFADDPGFADEDLANIQAVTAQDVMRVYAKYIKDRPFVAASFVPKGAPTLALEGAVRANVVEEEVVIGAEEEFDPSIEASYEPTPSSFDRSVEPPAGPSPVLATPDIWETQLANGLEVFGIEDSEIPLAEFTLSIDGGHLLDSVEKNGAANLLGELMTRGTADRTPAELEEAIAGLGAEIAVFASDEAMVLRGRTLARNFAPVMELVTEILLEPRWDEAEFELAKGLVDSQIVSQQTNPIQLAQLSAQFVAYGTDDIRAHSVLGSRTSLADLTIEDLKAFYEANLDPQLASFRIVGDVPEEEVLSALAPLANGWSKGTAQSPVVDPPSMPKSASIYFYDLPGAKQSVFTFTHPAMLRTDSDYFPASVANYRLGGGGFASRLTQQLREGKGYTYGVSSDFEGSAREGSFEIFSQVRSNVTLEATQLVRDILRDYALTYSAEDLAVTKSYFINSKARQFESFGAKLGILANVDLYNLPYDYVAKENEIVEAMSVEEIVRLASTYILPDRMNYVMVGDAQTQLDRLSALGLGEPVLVNDAVDQLME
jgi:zinc protease